MDAVGIRRDGTGVIIRVAHKSGIGIVRTWEVRQEGILAQGNAIISGPTHGGPGFTGEIVGLTSPADAQHHAV
jgi:hypothetical protein